MIHKFNFFQCIEFGILYNISKHPELDLLKKSQTWDFYLRFYLNQFSTFYFKFRLN